MLGTWPAMGIGEECVSLLDGFANRGISVSYEECCTVGGKLDEAALEKAIANSDVIVAAVGEYKDMSGEASSLSNIGLHGKQDKMLSLIKQAGKPLVTVLFNGRPLSIPDACKNSNAVVEAWHLGTQAGNCICDVLFGDYNPSGCLTMTFPNTVGECPIYYNHVSTGRPTSEIRHSCKYMDSPLTPLFPFGYGLSYTEYKYKNFNLFDKGNKIMAEVEVENIGGVSGEETVQLYTHTEKAVRAKPVKELKAFAKVKLNPGETKKVILTVDKTAFKYYDMNMNLIDSKGKIKFFIGHDSTANLECSINI